MKFIILGDLHAGARNGSNHFSEYFNRFFLNTLYPFMESNGITEIMQLGDIFDSRTQLSYKAYHKVKPIWFDLLESKGFKMFVLLGNHDIAYRTSLSINSPQLLLSGYSNIQIIDKPTVIQIAGMNVDVIPWILQENQDDIYKFLKRKNPSKILFGHLEVAGFKVMGSELFSDGIKTNVFDAYDMVYTGHYHNQVKVGNIQYTGIPYEITWNDYGSPKGFWVYDTDLLYAEFIPNPERMFYKIIWKNKPPKDFDPKVLKDKIVKLIVHESKEPIKLEQFIAKLQDIGPYSLDVIEYQNQIDADSDSEDFQYESTDVTIREYISARDYPTVDKGQLSKYMLDLYAEAQMLQSR